MKNTFLSLFLNEDFCHVIEKFGLDDSHLHTNHMSMRIETNNRNMYTSGGTNGVPYV